MPFTTPSASQFRERFPEFESATDYPAGVVTALLAEAEGGVGTDWMERDYQPGLMYLAAHLLQTQTDQRKRVQASSGSGSASSDGLGMVKSITTGNRTVSFETKANTQSADAGESSDENEFASTYYGQQYLRLLRRNVLGIMTLNAG